MRIAKDVDAYTVDELDGEKVIVTLPNMAGESGTRWEGSAVFGRDYLLDLIGYAKKHGIVSAADLARLARR